MTAYESLISDWISDVCSSGLREHRQREQPRRHGRVEHRQLGIETEQRRNSGKREHERHEREREAGARLRHRSEEHTSELQSLMRISYAVFCLKKKHITFTQHLLQRPPTPLAPTQHPTHTT